MIDELLQHQLHALHHPCYTDDQLLDEAFGWRLAPPEDVWTLRLTVNMTIGLGAGVRPVWHCSLGYWHRYGQRRMRTSEWKEEEAIRGVHIAKRYLAPVGQGPLTAEKGEWALHIKRDLSDPEIVLARMQSGRQ